MDVGNIYMTLLQIAVSTLLAVTIYILSSRAARRDYNSRNRPIVSLSGLSLDANRIEIFAGRNVKWIAWDFSWLDIYNILESGPKLGTISLSYEKKKENLMLISTFPKKIDFNNVILALKVINFDFSFANIKVSQFMIREVIFIVPNKKKDLYNYFDWKGEHVPFMVTNDSIRISLCYACLENQNMIMNIYNINNLWGNKLSSINFLESSDEAKKYLRFRKAIFLLQCKTVNEDIYYYSLFLEVRAGKLMTPIVENGKKLFKRVIVESANMGKFRDIIRS